MLERIFITSKANVTPQDLDIRNCGCWNQVKIKVLEEQWVGQYPWREWIDDVLGLGSSSYRIEGENWQREVEVGQSLVNGRCIQVRGEMTGIWLE